MKKKKKDSERLAQRAYLASGSYIVPRGYAKSWVKPWFCRWVPGQSGTVLWRDGELLTSSIQYMSWVVVIHSLKTQSPKQPLGGVMLWHGEGLT